MKDQGPIFGDGFVMGGVPMPGDCLDPGGCKAGVEGFDVVGLPDFAGAYAPLFEASARLGVRLGSEKSAELGAILLGIGAAGGSLDPAPLIAGVMNGYAAALPLVALLRPLLAPPAPPAPSPFVGVGDPAPRPPGPLDRPDLMYVTQRRPCPLCGSRFYGSSREGATWFRHCHGRASVRLEQGPCPFRWPEEADGLHFEHVLGPDGQPLTQPRVQGAYVTPEPPFGPIESPDPGEAPC